jgi:hypothetical protein
MEKSANSSSMIATASGRRPGDFQLGYFRCGPLRAVCSGVRVPLSTGHFGQVSPEALRPNSGVGWGQAG